MIVAGKQPALQYLTMDTAATPPADSVEDGAETPVPGMAYHVAARSVVVLISR